MPQIDRDTFLSGSNATFIAELYARYLHDPGAVDETWRQFFAQLGDEPAALERDLRGPGWGLERSHVLTNGHGNGAEAAVTLPAGSVDELRRTAVDSIRALQLIRSYRVRGHLEANLDPLGLMKIEPHPELDPATYGFTRD